MRTYFEPSCGWTVFSDLLNWKKRLQASALSCGWTVFSDLLNLAWRDYTDVRRCGWTVFSDLLNSTGWAYHCAGELRLDRVF